MIYFITNFYVSIYSFKKRNRYYYLFNYQIFSNIKDGYKEIALIAET